MKFPKIVSLGPAFLIATGLLFHACSGEEGTGLFSSDTGQSQSQPGAHEKGKPSKSM